MRQFDQAKEILTRVLKVESTCTEALFLLCWTLTANLVVQRNKTVGNPQEKSDTTAFSEQRTIPSAIPATATQNMASLQMAQDCLAILKKQVEQSELEYLAVSEELKDGTLECYNNHASIQSLST